MIRYRNPVVRGTAPDPSVVRVGADFYLVTSSFELFPGLVIRHSTDLITWTVIGAAVQRSSQVRRDGQPGAVSLFAPTIRYGDGRFVIACTNVAPGQGNFLVTADDPAGPWSDAIWEDEAGFDPSLLHDDGRWIYTRRSLDPLPDGRLGPVVQAEIDIDSGVLGPLVAVTPDHQGWCSNDIEGPHLYRIGDWYYLFAAEGGTWKGHMQTVARSRTPFGPFEPCPDNPVLTHRHRVGHPVQSVGHAELIDTPAGEWWALCLGTRHQGSGPLTVHHNLGRETFLLPVEWRDGWPVLGAEGRVDLDMAVDREPLPASRSTPSVRDHAAEWRTLGDPGRWLAADAMTVAVPVGLRWDASISDALSRAAPIGARLSAQLEDEHRQVVELGLPTIGESDAAVGGGFWSDAEHWCAITVRVMGGDVEVVAELCIDDVRSRETRKMPLTSVSAKVLLELDARPERYRVALHDSAGRELATVRCRARLFSAEATEWFTGVHLMLVAAAPDRASDADGLPVEIVVTVHESAAVPPLGATDIATAAVAPAL
ncbi:glycoside hydrolase family 43 protein [Microcella humidisoli]|uniref:Glycoside hydrolase family 43 protein n=1 Tax=Microcella humidisoli TaxID=2963406 RepID=A0ABY5FZ68_9MICO|nr:glycoside hydrolase family 43 protein [Microcella humidisoli]UTT63623.1 glycoside hydrolase family 43 protein [Microcella humidisoli]